MSFLKAKHLPHGGKVKACQAIAWPAKPTAWDEGLKKDLRERH